MINKTDNSGLAVLVVVMIIVLSCAGTRIATPTLQALKNAEYRSDLSTRENVKLVDGIYREKIVPGSASELVIRLSDTFAVGDLDHNGGKDAAVILISNAGGSGTFFHLASVINKKGFLKHTGSVHLGDRIKLLSLSIKAGVIKVEMMKQGPNDPMTRTSLKVTNRYVLKGDDLVPLK